MLRGFFVPILMLASATAAADEVYRHVDADGTVRYSDQPPHRDAKPLQLGTPSGVTPGDVKPRKRFYSAEALRAAARFAVSVESPTPGQVLRSGVDRAVVAANVMPGLVAGFGLMYFLDGKALSERPSDELSLLLPELAPGSYRLSVSVVDPRGREVARSPDSAFIVGAP